MAHPLEIDNVTVRYGEATAVDSIAFDVRPGEIFGLLGPNGAGKTSLISTIVTLVEPTEGQVRVFGTDVTKNPKRTKMLTGCVPQELVNHGFFSVEEILEIYSGYYGITNNKAQIELLINKLALAPERKKSIKMLSGGMKRRLLIAKALLHKPKLLLLDEPTAGVDVELRLGLWNFVRELQASGISILLTTHYLEEAEELCDRVGIIDHGVLKKVGNPKDLVEQFTSREVVIALNSDVPAVNHPQLTSQKDRHLIFRLSAQQEVGQLLAALSFDLSKIKNMWIREGNLEEAFKAILGNHHEH